MKERPILFGAPMVRALLDGSKTQTRRVVKGSDEWPLSAVRATVLESRGTAMAIDARRLSYGPEIKCPFGVTGDRLWVRETTVNVEDFGYLGPVYAESDHGRNVLEYGLAPSEGDCTEVEPEDINLRPSIFMPRAMCRITLENVSVRVERLQDISEADAKAEGITSVVFRPDTGWPLCDGYMVGPDDGKTALETSAVKAYRNLWESINGPGSWDANPWVWVIEFKRVKS